MRASGLSRASEDAEALLRHRREQSAHRPICGRRSLSLRCMPLAVEAQAAGRTWHWDSKLLPSMQPGRAWGAVRSAGDARLHGPPSTSAVSCTHAFSVDFDQKPSVAARRPRAACVLRPHQRAHAAGLSGCCSRSRKCRHLRRESAVLPRPDDDPCSRGEGLGAGLRRFCFRRRFAAAAPPRRARQGRRRRQPIVRQ